MNYTVTVYDKDKIVDTYYLESHFKARLLARDLEERYADEQYTIKIEEV